MHLQCEDGHVISSIEFASYGTPQGSCQKFSRGNCHAATSLSVVSKVNAMITILWTNGFRCWSTDCDELNPIHCDWKPHLSSQDSFRDKSRRRVKKKKITYWTTLISIHSFPVAATLTYNNNIHETIWKQLPKIYRSAIFQACQGKNSCSIGVSNAIFGDPCRGTVKTLAVEATCMSSSNIGLSLFWNGEQLMQWNIEDVKLVFWSTSEPAVSGVSWLYLQFYIKYVHASCLEPVMLKVQPANSK